MATPDLVGTLERVLTRVGLTEDDKLEGVVKKLLPIVLRNMDNSKDPKVPKVGMDILHLVNRRTAPLPELLYPVGELIEVFRGAKTALCRNLALLYIERGVDKYPLKDRFSFFSELLLGVSSTEITAQQRAIVLRTASMCLEELGSQAEAAIKSSSLSSFLLSADGSETCEMPALQGDEERKVLLEYVLLLMLYKGPSPSSQAQNARQQSFMDNMSEVSSTQHANSSQIMNLGLSREDVEAIEGSKVPDSATVIRRKLGFLVLSAHAGLPPHEVLGIYIAASEDGANDVALAGGELLKRRCAFTGAHPPIQIEDNGIVTSLWNLLVGDYGRTDIRIEFLMRNRSLIGSASTDTLNSALQPRPPPNSAVQARVLTLLCRSAAAAKILADQIPGLVAILFFEREIKLHGNLASYQSDDQGDQVHRQHRSQHRLKLSPHGVAVAKGLSPSLREKVIEFVQWAMKHMEYNQAVKVSSDILDILDAVGFLGDQYQSDPQDEQANMMEERKVFFRGQKFQTLTEFLYNIIGIISHRTPSLMDGRVDIVERCFLGLAGDPPGLRTAASEATNSLAGAFAHHFQSLKDNESRFTVVRNGQFNAEIGKPGATDEKPPPMDRILSLLEKSIVHSEEAVRFAALRWVKEVFPFHFVQARYLCIIGAGDTSWQIREAALGGLDPSSFRSALSGVAVRGKTTQSTSEPSRDRISRPVVPSNDTETSTMKHNGKEEAPAVSGSTPEACVSAAAMNKSEERSSPPAPPSYPSFSSMLAYMIERQPQLSMPGKDTNCLPLPGQSMIGAIQFLEACRSHHCRIGQDRPTALSTEEAYRYLVLLENAMAREAPAELHLLALQAVLLTSHTCPSALSRAFANRWDVFRRALRSTSGEVRTAAARLIGMLSRHMSVKEAEKTISDMQTSLLADLDRDSTGDGPGRKLSFEELDGRIATMGFLCAHVALGRPPVSTSKINGMVKLLVKFVAHDKLDPEIRASAALALGYASTPLPTPIMSSIEDVSVITDAVIELLNTKMAGKNSRKIVQALGFVARGHRTHGVLSPITISLLGLRDVKDRHVVAMVGEALSFVFGGVQVSTEELLCTSFESLEKRATAETDVSSFDPQRSPLADSGSIARAVGASSERLLDDSSAAESDSSLHEPRVRDSIEKQSSIDNTVADAAASAGEATEDSVEEVEVRALILRSIFEELVVHVRPEIRFAGASWLVALLMHCGQTRTEIRRHIRRAQESLATLLADDNDATQELATRGLSVAYELADPVLKEELVHSLISSLTGAPGRKRRAADISADSKLFEPGTLGAGPGGSGLSTYREICQLATDMGQPDLMYKFMQLANADATANASRGAAYGFASIVRRARGPELSDRVDALIPRLYRSLYDPQPKVRDAMHHIWMALVDDTHDAVSRHFDSITRSLVQEMTGPQWKIREASAAAAADVLQGRRWEEVGPHLRSLWSASFRVVDDVKESVRRSGFKLVRSLKSLTCRLTDAALTPADERRSALSAVLPVLLESGLTSQVPEIRAITVDTIVSVIRGAGSEEIRHHMKEIITPLLESLSGLEDARLNYIEQHASRFGVDASELENARVMAAHGSSLGESIDLCARAMDDATFAAVAPALSEIIRRGTGVATRAGTGRFVVNVTHRLRSSAAGGAPPLVKALQEAAFSERSPVVRKSYASAWAILTANSQEETVERAMRRLLKKARNREAETSDQHGVTGMLLRALSREGAEVFAEWASEILPIAFTSRFDTDGKISEIWEDVWEELRGVPGANLRVHLKPVLDVALGQLEQSSWSTKRSGAMAIAALASSVRPESWAPLCAYTVKCLLQQLPGRLWDGKESVLHALGAAMMACVSGSSSDQKEAPGRSAPRDVEILCPEILEALVQAARKKKLVYRMEALKQLEIFLGHPWPTVDASLLPEQPLMEILDEFMHVGDILSHGVEEKGAEIHPSDVASLKESPIAEILRCLGAMWGSPSGGTMPQEKGRIEMICEKLVLVIQNVVRVEHRLAAVEACRAFLGSIVAAEGRQVQGIGGAVQLLVDAIIRLSGDDKISSVREKCVKVLNYVFCEGAALCGEVGAKQLSAWCVRLEEMMQMERDLAVQQALKMAKENLMLTLCS